MRHLMRNLVLGGAVAAIVGSTALAQERPTSPAEPRANEARPDPARTTTTEAQRPITMRASRVSGTVTGMKVENPAGENVGRIEDLMLDMRTGKIQYAAVSTGGFLGIADRLHAVPFHALKLMHRDDDYFFVLNVDKERLKEAPGFDKGNWPDFANERWSADIDAFYRSKATERPRVNDRVRPQPEP